MSDNRNDKTIECTQGAINRTQIEQLWRSDAKQWTVLEKLQNRLPAWATFLIALLGTIIGAMASTLIKG